jgi:hypothetical protein
MRPLRVTLAAVAAVAALLAFSAVAQAAPHFAAASSSVNNDGALVVDFDERGLGNGNIDYTLTADATATYACINRGGKNPEAANKQTFNAEVSGGGSFEAKNGRVQASLSAGPISAGDFSCPSGQRLVLAAVSYSNIVLTDTTNNVSTTVPNVSRTFFDV